MALERPLRVVAAFVVSLTAALAQNTTVPALLQGVEGGGGTSIPFGSNLACRYQCLYEAIELPWSGPRVITGLRLRPDLNTSPQPVPQKGFLEISVLMSTTDRDITNMSPVFAENYGTDATLVINRQLVMLPAQPPQASGPMPANIPLVFTVPWVFGLTPVVQGMPPPRNLLVEIHIHSQPAGIYRIDNVGNCSAHQSMVAGSSYTWRVQGAPPSMPFLIGLNLVGGGFLLDNPAWPLPYPMFDPANPTLPSPALAALVYPAPDCYLNMNMPVFLSGISDAGGVGTASAVLPAGRQNVGTTFYAQALILAPTANPLRFITTQGYGATICGPLGVARNFAFYNNTLVPPPVPTSGSVQAGVCMVFEVQ
jgi:hypothetical protein